MTDSKLLIAAADLIEQNGLRKFDLWPGTWRYASYKAGSPCSPLGALAVVSGIRHVSLVWTIRRRPVFTKLKAYISATNDHEFYDWVWDCSQSHIINIMRAAADYVKATDERDYIRDRDGQR